MVQTWKPHKKGGTTYNITTGVEIERPNKAIRVTLKSRSERTWVFHKGAQRSTETAQKKKEVETNHSKICNRITGQIRTKGRMAELARDLRKGTLIGGSDASVAQGKGTGAWMITKSNDLNTTMEGEGSIDGNPKTMHSTKAERGRQ